MGHPYGEVMDSRASTIGQEIRRFRTWRGMTLEALAGQAGITKGYLSKIERGEVPIDRRSLLLKIAQALRVSLADLGGVQVLTDHADSEAHATIPDIRYAFLATSLEDADRPASRPMAELRATTLDLAQWRQDCRYADVGRALPGLLTDLHATAASGGDDRPDALRSLVQAAQVATLLVKNLGAVDLAWVAAERGHEAAVQLGDPVFVAASDFARTQALVGLGAYQRADTLARKAAELLASARTSAELQVYGTSVLTAAFCSGVLGGDDPEEAIREAIGVARHAGDEDANAFFLAFSTANVQLWRLSIALEAGDAVKAVEIAESLRLEDLPMRSRQVAYLIDYARALYALRGKDERVVKLLLQAEKLGTTRTHHNLFVREIVTEMRERARRDTATRELRGLADRMGLLRAV